MQSVMLPLGVTDCKHLAELLSGLMLHITQYLKLRWSIEQQ